jgi:hypothetical protein
MNATDQPQEGGLRQETGSANGFVRRGKLNLLFPLSALLSVLFILSILVVANPISHEFDGPFVRFMKIHGMWIMALEVVAILVSGTGAMWLEARSTPLSNTAPTGIETVAKKIPSGDSPDSPFRPPSGS